MIKSVELKENSDDKILDRIANKILHECEQLPDGKQNILVTKTEGIFVSSDDIIDAIIGKPSLVINKSTMATIEKRGKAAFRTENDLMAVIQKISAIIAYEHVCQHGKLKGIFGNNTNNAKVPLKKEIQTIFNDFLCDKC